MFSSDAQRMVTHSDNTPRGVGRVARQVGGVRSEQGKRIVTAQRVSDVAINAVVFSEEL